MIGRKWCQSSNEIKETLSDVYESLEAIEELRKQEPSGHAQAESTDWEPSR